MQNPLPMPPQPLPQPLGPPVSFGGSNGSAGGGTGFRFEPLPPGVAGGDSGGGQIVPVDTTGGGISPQPTFGQRLQNIPWWGWALIFGGGYLAWQWYKRGKDPRYWGAPA